MYTVTIAVWAMQIPSNLSWNAPGVAKVQTIKYISLRLSIALQTSNNLVDLTL